MMALFIVICILIAIFLNILLVSMPVNDNIFIVELFYIFMMLYAGYGKLFILGQKEQAFHYAFNLNPLRLFIKTKFLFLWFLVGVLGFFENWIALIIPDFHQYYLTFLEVVLKATMIMFNYYLARICIPIFTDEVLE